MTTGPNSLDRRITIEGTGEPLLFISGANDDRHGWDPTLSAFEEFRRITFDNRDIGVGPYVAAEYTIEEMAEETIAVLDRAGVESAHLVGHSMGGAIAQWVAVLAPERVRSLVLVGTWAKADHYFRDAIQLWIDWSEILTPRDFARSAAFFWMGASTINAASLDGVADEITPLITAQPFDALRRQLRAVIRHDSAAKLRSVRVPTLVVRGEDDRIVLDHHARELVEAIPTARYVSIRGAGHAPHLEAPGAFNAAVLDFLATASHVA